MVHVDAAKNIVAWARRNAELSGLAAAPIRWIVEDAMKFVKRELRRGNRYDAVILDPPSYGHGPRGEVWRLSKHLPRLLSLCGELTAGRPEFMLLTCHSPGLRAGYAPHDAGRSLGERRDRCRRPLALRSDAGRELPSGTVVRWKPGNAKEAADTMNDEAKPLDHQSAQPARERCRPAPRSTPAGEARADPHRRRPGAGPRDGRRRAAGGSVRLRGAVAAAVTRDACWLSWPTAAARCCPSAKGFFRNWRSASGPKACWA